MQKPPTRTHRQTAVGELGLVIAARMSNDHNYMLKITFLSIAECVINVCMCVCIRERITIMGCLAVVTTIIGLMTDYCTYCIYGLINGLLYKPHYISNCRYRNISAKM